MNPVRPAPDAREEGQIMVLSLVLMLIAMLLIAIAVVSTALHLDRVRLWNLADQAALYASGVADQSQLYAEDYLGAEGVVPISDSTVRAAVEKYLNRSNSAGSTGSLTDIEVTVATTPDGQTAVVGLAGVSRPTLLGWLVQTFGGRQGVHLSVESAARAGTVTP